ncbi:MAG: bifunctional folylpolyglutamate synthase/dihydrofolate synthase [Anaerobacillus sp.]|uniref:bifunctional folylpolyglutamate synthase/dihydrofolate synthase n=1 Tax=Anaerobacillus sp. TaxID=1872506 RepID=UPI00391D3999
MLYTMIEAEALIYKSYLRAIGNIQETDDSKVKKIKLTRQLFDLLDSPDLGQRFVLVTGSKGKGSISRFISSLLGHLGFKVGLFTSPHLVNFNERIRINGKAISDDDFIRLSKKLEKPFEMIEMKLALDEYQGPIGLSLAIAALYFKENQTDINVIECGRGGEFDDTNILSNEWAVITPIMEEHLPNLGPTIEHIITHKLGIVKAQTKFVYISQQADILAKIEAELRKKFVENVSYYGRDFYSENISLHAAGTIFDVKTSKERYQQIALPLLGGFNAINGATAIKVCEDIINAPISPIILKNCFQTIRWPGRCEIVSRNPTVIVDGAINERSAKYVQELLASIPGKKIVSIVGIPANKDYKGVIKVLSEFSSKIIVTKPDISHLKFPSDAAIYAQTFLQNSLETDLLVEAVEIAKKEHAVDIIVIIGTQTLIANAKRIWNHSLMDIGL